MSSEQAKSINGLMRHMREDKGIQISNSEQKRKLRNMGYYHGYKGYRFYKAASKPLKYTNFSEIQAVYDFDMHLKTLLYPQIMFIETAYKNRALEVFIGETKSSRFLDVYNKVLTNHKSYKTGSGDFKNALNKRLKLREKIYGNLARDYSQNLIVKHFYEKDESVPIWAIMESLTMGEFGFLLECANAPVKQKIAKSVGFHIGYDTNGKLLIRIVYLLKDLRNAVAHNKPVFDTRFQSGKISQNLSSYVENQTGASDVMFDTIADYIILIAMLLKGLGQPKSEIARFLKEYERLCEELRGKIPVEIYSVIIHTNTRLKMQLVAENL